MYSKKCIQCGAQFESTNNAQQLCGNECRKTRRLENKRLYNDYETGWIPCRECGKKFLTHHNVKVCSEECRKSRKRKKHNNVQKRLRAPNKKAYYEFTHEVTGERYRLYESGVTRKVEA